MRDARRGRYIDSRVNGSLESQFFKRYLCLSSTLVYIEISSLFTQHEFFFVSLFFSLRVTSLSTSTRLSENQIFRSSPYSYDNIPRIFLLASTLNPNIGYWIGSHDDEFVSVLNSQANPRLISPSIDRKDFCSM